MAADDATFWQRAGAALVDLLAVSFAVGLLLRTGLPGVRNAGARGAFELAALWAWWALFEGSTLQATPGKLALGLRVATLAGAPVDFARASGRSLGRILSSFLLCTGFLVACFTARRQALHDLLAGTVVVRVGAAAGARATTAPAAGASPARHPASAGGNEALVVLAGMAGLTMVGLIASVAVPAFRDRDARAQVAEALALSADAKQAISEALAAGEEPESIDQQSLRLGEPVSSETVEFVRVTAGSVVIRFSGKASHALAGQFIVIAPARNDINQIDWLCGRHAAPEGWEPLVPSAARHTTVADRYLPPLCRR